MGLGCLLTPPPKSDFWNVIRTSMYICVYGLLIFCSGSSGLRPYPNICQRRQRIAVQKANKSDDGGAGKHHPGLWKIPPWVVENSTQAFGKYHPGFCKIPPRLLENTTQGSGKLQNVHEPCDYTFLDKQVSKEKLKKCPRYVELNWTIFMYV